MPEIIIVNPSNECQDLYINNPLPCLTKEETEVTWQVESIQLLGMWQWVWISTTPNMVWGHYKQNTGHHFQEDQISVLHCSGSSFYTSPNYWPLKNSRVKTALVRCWWENSFNTPCYRFALELFVLTKKKKKTLVFLLY